MVKIKFRDDVLWLKLQKYRDGSPAIQAYDTDGEPYMSVSTNLGKDVKLRDDEIAIKDWSENRGILDALVKQKVISKPVRYERSGFVKVPIVKFVKAKFI